MFGDHYVEDVVMFCEQLFLPVNISSRLFFADDFLARNNELMSSSQKIVGKT